jgi:Na+-transporting methylmalonyl-CoA/oxaloacetate decarboxylase gamma subunit
MGIPVLFLGFIGTVFGIPASLISIVQFMSPVVRKVTHSHTEGSALKPALARVSDDHGFPAAGRDVT